MWTTHEQCDICMQIQILWTSCQHYTDQEECIFISPRVKMNDKLHSVLHWYELMLDIFFCLWVKKKNDVKKKKTGKKGISDILMEG